MQNSPWLMSPPVGRGQRGYSLKFALLLLYAVSCGTLAAQETGRVVSSTDSAGEFLPGKKGTLAAWLIAGPFVAPQPELEKSLAGNSIPRADDSVLGHPDKKWLFRNVGERKTLSLTSSGTKKTGELYYYLFCELVADTPSSEVILLSCNGSGEWWLDGKRLKPTLYNQNGGVAQSSQGIHFTTGRHPLLVRIKTRRQRGVLWLGVFPLLPDSTIKPDALSLLRQRIRVPAFSAKKPLSAYAPPLILQPTPRFIEQESRLYLTLKLAPGTPFAKGAMRLRLSTAPDKKSGATPWLEHTQNNFSLATARTKGIRVALPLQTQVTWSRLQINATLSAGNTVLATTSTPLFSAKNLFAREAEIRAQQPASLAKPQLQSILALLRLSLEQFELLRQGRQNRTRKYGELANSYLTRAEECLLALRQGRDPQQGLTGTVERAYISPIDNSVQPYRVYIPHRISALTKGGKKLPLLVLLHGYVPSYTKLRWFNIDAQMGAAMEKLGMVMLLPFGRSCTDFLSIGEEDVLRTIKEMEKHYPIDARRIYLAGYSMGGSGVWTLLSHRPDLFAAAQIWSGRTDYYYWHSEKLAAAGIRSPAEMPFYKRVLINLDNPWNLSDTLRSIPIHAFHPQTDQLVKVGQTRRIFEKLKPPLGKMRVSLPARGTHWSYSIPMHQAATYRWLLSHTAAPPDLVEHLTYSPKYGKKYWLEIAQIRTWGKPASVRAWLDHTAKKIVIEKADNVAVLEILANGQPKLVANEKYRIEIKSSVTSLPTTITPPHGWKNGRITITFGKEKAAEFKKRAGLTGPVKEAFNTAFLLVVGTLGKAVVKQKNSQNAAQFSRDWQTFAHAKAPQKNDTAVTAEDIRDKNLILFGSPTSNSYLKKIAARIPFKFYKDGYGVAGKRVRGQGLGFVGIYPQPRQQAVRKPPRYIVVIDGLYYGQSLSFNHKWDLVPDFIIFDKTNTRYDGANTARLAGFFNSDWQFDQTLLTLPTPVATVPLR